MTFDPEVLALLKRTAGDLVMHIHEEKWQQTQAKIEEALRDAYAAGVTVGSMKPKAESPVCPCGAIHGDPVVASYDTDGGAPLDADFEAGCV